MDLIPINSPLSTSNSKRLFRAIFIPLFLSAGSLSANTGIGTVTIEFNGTAYIVGSKKYDNFDTFTSEVESAPWYDQTDYSSAYTFALAGEDNISGFTGARTGSGYGPHFIYNLTTSSMQLVRYHTGHSSNGIETTMNPTININQWPNRYVAYVKSSSLIVTDTGDASFSISGTAAAGSTLTASVSSDDPDGNGTITSYTWESSSDGSTGWTTLSSGTESTYTLTSDEEGKYIRVTVAYTDGSSTAESVSSTSVSISQLHTEWLQPYAAMQNIGLKSIHNNRDLVLEKAGECNNNGWVIGDSDYCLYTNANNIVSYVNGNSTKGSYRSAVFNSSLNLEKTLNEKWKAGIAYGVGSSNLNNFNFSSTTASIGSTNTHYSIYGVKKVNDTFTLKGMIGGSDFDYKGKRNYSTTSATSSYDSDGYTAEINGNWDIKKTIKNMKTPIRLKPSVGVAYAAHTQEGFSESGSGDLITVDANQAESLLFKTGISIDKKISMEGGKWLLVPSLALNYEMDTYADDSHRSIKGGLTESSTEHTLVSAKTFGQHNGSLEVGADFVLTKDFVFNLKAEYGLAEGGDEYAYGGGFSWQF
jgi:hypothetical protein